MLTLENARERPDYSRAGDLYLAAQRYEAERNSARHWNQYLIGASVFLLLALLYVAMHSPPPTAAGECRAADVMQLDPTTVRARGTEVTEL